MAVRLENKLVVAISSRALFELDESNAIFKAKGFRNTKIPENIVAGQNIRVIAKVVEYNEKQGLFFLAPISTEIR